MDVAKMINPAAFKFFQEVGMVNQVHTVYSYRIVLYLLCAGAYMQDIDAVTMSYEAPVMPEAYQDMLDRIKLWATSLTPDCDTARDARSKIAAH